jgi:hypothetical protein
VADRPFTRGEIADRKQRAKRSQNGNSALHVSLGDVPQMTETLQFLGLITIIAGGRDCSGILDNLALPRGPELGLRLRPDVYP